jgi:DeoR family fructose operon transcriptional repressor
MLNEERYTKIMGILEEKRSASVAELSLATSTSESTVRRDLQHLHNQRKLTKVFGGAVIREEPFIRHLNGIQVRKNKNQEAKQAIGKFAASLVKNGDCVFIDAGSTLEVMPHYITAKDVLFVTNSINCNYTLVRRGFHSLLTGGDLLLVSDALYGPETIALLQRFNFTKCFFGADAVSVEGGFSVAIPAMGDVKRAVIKHCRYAYVAVDSSKLDTLAAVSFAGISDAAIITERLGNPRYREFAEVYETSL